MFLFRRNKNDLPIASTGYSGADGSGKAIHMDAPIVRAWKNSSMGTKATYYSLIACLLLMYGGYRHLRYSYASIWLVCHAQECTLQITPQGRRGTTKLTFPRKQLTRSQAVKVNKMGTFVSVDFGRDSGNYMYSQQGSAKRKKKKQVYNSKGPDRNGHYDSYCVHLKPPSEANANFADLSSIQGYTYENDAGEIVLQMRQFNLGQSRRRTRTLVSRVDSYIRERRHKLTLKENASLSWKGILALVLGLFGLLMTALIGQFADEHATYQGARRHRQQEQKRKQQLQQKRQQALARRRPVQQPPSRRAVQQQQQQRQSSARTSNNSTRYRPGEGSQQQAARSSNNSMRYRPGSGPRD